MTAIKKKTPFRNYQETDAGVASYSSFGDALKTLPKDFANDFFKQILGEGSSHNTNGELLEGQELVLSKVKKEQPKETAFGREYKREIITGESRKQKEEVHEITVQIQAIIAELKRLMASSREIQIQFKEIAQEQRITKPGKYHTSFFEWVFVVVKQARMKVEDAGAWLAMFKNKKGQRKYWNQAKKHGTSFTLNNERTLATQTG